MLLLSSPGAVHLVLGIVGQKVQLSIEVEI